jgi:hypothetical protein
MNDSHDRPLMAVLEGDAENDDCRKRRAWGLVADGVEAALIELGPLHPLRPVFLQMLCRCRRAAGLTRRARLTQTG